MRYAIIDNKVITNIIVANQDFIDANYPDAIECSDDVNIGHIYDKNKFIAPPENADIDEALAE